MIWVYASMTVLIMWNFVSSMGEEETIFHLQKKFLIEKNILFDELQSTKREIGEVFNELEKRQAYIQELEGELAAAKAELEELYKRLHEARLQTQATQKLSEQKEMQLAQTLKRETDELKRKLDKVTTLLEAFQTVSRNLNMNDSLLVVTDIIGKMIPSQSCILFLMDTVEGEKQLFAEVAASPYVEYFRNFSLKLGEGAPGWVGLNRQALKIDNGTVQVQGQELSTLLTYEKSALLVPLVCDDELLGVLYLGRQNANAYAAENLDTLDELLRLISVSLRNSMNYQKIITSGIYDEVTGLYNFLYFNERLTEEIKRGKRYNYSICLILIDVDHFSKYNEQFGAEMGDRVLKEVGAILKEHIRETDVVARLENDDFAIILVQSEKNSAILIGERIRMAMEMRSFGTRQRGRISVSLGIAAFPQDAQDRDTLIARSDKALGEAKTKGGNHTCFAQ
jgi:diguanylate cyclase (GGDEF)-like protein